MLQTIIFDYNGVLVDDLKIQRDSYLWAAKKLGFSLSAKIVSQYISHTTEQKREIYFGDITDEQWEKVLLAKTRYYFETVKKSDVVFPDVETVLNSLSTQYVLGLVSNTTRHYFDHVFPAHLSSLFREKLLVEDVETPKPSPEPLFKILRRLKIPKERCCYVGDSLLDVRMAKSAEISILAVATGGNSLAELRAAGADDVLGSLSELPRRLEVLYKRSP